jgi:hypothetical protein
MFYLSAGSLQQTEKKGFIHHDGKRIKEVFQRSSGSLPSL